MNNDDKSSDIKQKVEQMWNPAKQKMDKSTHDMEKVSTNTEQASDLYIRKSNDVLIRLEQLLWRHK
jgi:ElaB/YqjD/DUF883 family membrane-anchored ribosome-binding protein